MGAALQKLFGPAPAAATTNVWQPPPGSQVNPYWTPRGVEPGPFMTGEEMTSRQGVVEPSLVQPGDIAGGMVGTQAGRKLLGHALLDRPVGLSITDIYAKGLGQPKRAMYDLFKFYEKHSRELGVSNPMMAGSQAEADAAGDLLKAQMRKAYGTRAKGLMDTWRSLGMQAKAEEEGFSRVGPSDYPVLQGTAKELQRRYPRMGRRVPLVKVDKDLRPFARHYGGSNRITVREDVARGGWGAGQTVNTLSHEFGHAAQDVLETRYPKAAMPPLLRGSTPLPDDLYQFAKSALGQYGYTPEKIALFEQDSGPKGLVMRLLEEAQADKAGVKSAHRMGLETQMQWRPDRQVLQQNAKFLYERLGWPKGPPKGVPSLIEWYDTPR